MHSFNDQQIDADHDLIIMKFDELCSLACYTNYDSTRRLELMEQLKEYLSTHFEREEKLMSTTTYEHLPQHQMAHRNMKSEFIRMMKPKTTEGELSLDSDLYQMRKMFLSHIVTFDEAFGEWLSQRPLQEKPCRATEPKRGLARRLPSTAYGKGRHRVRMAHALRVPRIRL